MDEPQNRKLLIELIRKCPAKTNQPLKVELIKGHNLAVKKYESLSMEIPSYLGVSDELMKIYKKAIEEMGITAEICKE